MLDKILSIGKSCTIVMHFKKNLIPERALDGMQHLWFAHAGVR